MNIDRARDDVQFTRDIEPYVDGVLELDALATEHADRFLFDDAAQAMAFRRFLWDERLALCSPPHGMVALIDGRPVAMAAGLTWEDDFNRRMASAVALHRVPLLRDNPDLAPRLRLLAAISSPVEEGDYYWSRLSVDPSVKRRGLSRIVSDAAVDQARQRGCTRMVAEFSANNALIRRYLCWMGFREFSRGQADDPATGRHLSLVHVARTLEPA